jgi:Peptidase_C39 like family
MTRAAAVAAVFAAMIVQPPTAAADPLDGAWPTDFHAWTTAADFAAGTAEGVSAVGDAITLAAGATDGSWTSPWYAPAAGFSQLVPSWQPSTPSGSWVEIGLQVRTATTESQWFEMGQWAFDTSTIKRSSIDKQNDDPVGLIFTDTFVARSTAPGGRPAEYRLRATLHGTATASPTVRQLAATAAVPGALPATSTPLSTTAVELAVPRYSQSIHSGEYKKFGGGGSVWCSPTSSSMVLSYFGVGPTAADVASLPPDKTFDRNGRVDGVVDWAAIHTWDYVYDGSGNWPFNAAYASEYGLDGSIRQYSTLRAVESWVHAGVPVVVSIRWDNTDADPLNDLDGSSITGTDGHIMVVVGFTAAGDVIANDPASPSDAAVRHVYRRDQFERNWLRASDGTTYILKPQSIGG